MSTKITSSSSICYLNNVRGFHKIHGLYNLSTIKRLKMIDQPRLFLKLDNGRVMSTNLKPRASSSSSPISSSSGSPWTKWLWGFLLTVILPAAGHKGGLLFGLKGKVDQAIETVDHVTELVEKIAEEAEKVVEEVEEKLPGDSKIKEALESFEDLTKVAVKEARKADDLVHKVKDMEQQIDEVLIKGGKDEDKN